MSIWRYVSAACRRLFHRTRDQAELTAELESWVDITAGRYRRQGMPAAAARRRALIELEGMDQVKERVRWSRPGFSLELLGQDVRRSARSLARRPAFSATIIAILALALAAYGSIFSVANAILLQTPPGIERPEELVEINRGDDQNRVDVSYPVVRHLRETSRSLVDAAAMRPARVALGESGLPRVVSGLQVSGNFFDVLGVRPLLGRFPSAEAAFYPRVRPGLVISHRLWQEQLSGADSVIGRTLSINGYPAEVLAVTPPGFRGPVTVLGIDVFVLMGTPAAGLFSPARLDDPYDNDLSGIGRLAAGVTLQQAEAELTQVAERFMRIEAPRLDRYPIQLDPYGPLPGMVRTQAVLFFSILLGIVGIGLLIACVNITNMLLARGADRSRELAVRLAMGASRWRVVRQLLIESLLLFGVAAVVGLLLAAWLTRLMPRLLPSNLPLVLELDARPDWLVAAVTLVLALVVGVVAGVFPALRATRPDLIAALKLDSIRPTSSGSWLRPLLVAAQMSATVILLVISGLFLRTLDTAQSVELGFEPEGVQVARFDLELSGYDGGDSHQFYTRLMQRVAGLAGVEAVALSHKLPIASRSGLGGIQVPGVESPNEFGFQANFLRIDGRYFAATGIRIEEGVGLAGGDAADGPAPVVVNRTMANRLWPEQDAVGRRLEAGQTRLQVVGVASDALYHELGETTPNFMYMPYRRYSGASPAMNLLIKTRPESGLTLGQLQTEVNALDVSVPVLMLAPLSQEVGSLFLLQRLAAWVSGLVGLFALLLGALGVYGVTAYAVSHRSQEIGIRLAMGADRAQVRRLIVRQGMVWPLLGLGLGVMVSAGLTNLLASLLFGVSPLDPATFGGVLLLLASVAVIATDLPARRASRLDPARTLKAD